MEQTQDPEGRDNITREERARKSETQQERRKRQLKEFCRTPDISIAGDKSLGELKHGIVYTTRELVILAGRLKLLAIELLHRTGEDSAVKLLADVTKLSQKTVAQIRGNELLQELWWQVMEDCYEEEDNNRKTENQR